MSLSPPALPKRVDFRVLPDYEAMSVAAANAVLATVRARPNAILCLPTGASPERLFELLVLAHQDDPALFRQVRVLKLDEWGGLDMDDPASCEGYLQTRVIRPLAISPDRCVSWQSRPNDARTECARIAAWLERNGPIDVSVLGIGLNGHLGLNEPGDFLQPSPHVAALTPESLEHGMLRTARRQPEYGLTLGMADLLASRHVLVLASGAAKAEPLRRLFRREITSQFPASFLWLHPALTLLCDRAAAAGIRET